MESTNVLMLSDSLDSRIFNLPVIVCEMQFSIHILPRFIREQFQLNKLLKFQWKLPQSAKLESDRITSNRIINRFKNHRITRNAEIVCLDEIIAVIKFYVSNCSGLCHYKYTVTIFFYWIARFCDRPNRWRCHGVSSLYLLSLTIYSSNWK